MDKFRKAGGWIALSREATGQIDLFERGEPRGRHAVPAGQNIWSLAVSETGALAVVAGADDGAASLHLVRGTKALDYAIPSALEVLAWVGHGTREIR